MRSNRMSTITFNPRLNLQIGKESHQHGPVIEENEGLIKVYNDGYVERLPIVPNVAPTVAAPELGVISKDVIIDKFTGIWARFYVPRCQLKLPLMVYFHGGGFCVGSASWSCYHEFLAKLASKAGCVIMSVNYRLAPENRLPAAYEDGCNAVMWVKHEALNGSVDQRWWCSQCNFSKVFLAGDSAGANIAHNVVSRLGSLVAATDQCTIPKPLCIKAVILIQPFFGGEARTHSERYMTQPPTSALTLPASDVYWRLSLPIGANCDNPWCNPLGGTNLEALRLPPTLVCISEMDILRDRNLEFCTAMARAGKRVEQVVYKGVGHAFQILNNSQVSQLRTHEMISHIKAFMNQ
ncbi:probable carboxylesterase 17 [Macadamia integrifolia]|uniref:probable carboxylesterase 17 n=1 Tax=Macadamia integrifolia TaxID=60698 RepID=UPI001C4F4D87|nr:probable carboxylesterase 17 [Macadamia integrifolia]